MSMTEQCEPHVHKLKQPRAYATIVPGRYPEVKAYTNLGGAKSSIAYSSWRRCRGGQLYEFIDGEWQLLYTVERGTQTEDLPWKKEAK